MVSRHLDDDITLSNVPQERRVHQLALYASHLASGDTLACRAIKADTIASYLRQISKFLYRYCRRDCRKINEADKTLAPPIQHILDELRRWEKVPHKREPHTAQMQQFLQKVPLSARRPPDTVCTHFFALGLRLGLRLTEWANPDSHPHPNAALLDEKLVPKAITLADIEFRATGNKRLAHN